MTKTKTLLMAGLGSLVLGGLILGTGMVMGGTPGFYVDKSGIHSAEELYQEPSVIQMEKTKVDAFSNIDASMDYGQIHILPGDGYYVEYAVYSNGTGPDFRIEDGTLTFREDPDTARDSHSPYLIVDFSGLTQNAPASKEEFYLNLYVPKNAELGSVKLYNDSGDVKIEAALSCQKAAITCSYGDLYLQKLTAKKTAFLSCEAGKMDLETIQAADLQLHNEYGDITCGQLKGQNGSILLESGDLLTQEADFDNLKIVSEYGDVTCSLARDLNQYQGRLLTEYGSIEFPDLRIQDQDKEGEYLLDGTGKAQLSILCESGDIQITP